MKDEEVTKPTTITIFAKVLAMQDFQYQAYVVEDLNRHENDELKYITVVRVPN